MHTISATVATLSLLVLLSGCASYYEDRCVAQGYESGSSAHSACVQSEIQQARWNRHRHMTYGGGGP